MAIIKLQKEEEKKKGIYYELDTNGKRLGEGGMGIVYLGKRYASNGTVTPVAIKELKIKDSEIIERARREAGIQLNNEHLVRMYGMIEVEHDDALLTSDYYVISEYVEGVMLDDVLEGKLKNRDGVVFPKVKEFYDNYEEDRNGTATKVIKSILSGVMALHDAGYIHRDIDPTNIMLTSEGKIKLIDFGIAKKLESIQSQKSELTTPGQFIGKAEYAAPELILGDTRNQNFYTDIYAIGILYYQLIVGHVPFQGAKYEVIEDQLRKRVPLKDISSWQIRDIIRKATEKKQGDRYASSALFRAAIDNIIIPEPKKINYRLIGSIAAAIVIIGLVIALVSGNKSEGDKGNVAVADTVAKKDTIDLYKLYLNNLNSAIEDSIKSGFEGMKRLAEQGNVDAMYEVGSTYALTLKDDALSTKVRKSALQLKSSMESPQQNENAKKWLSMAITSSDSTHYKAIYLMTPYLYQEGKAELSKAMCKKAYDLALKKGDMEYAKRIEKTIKSFN
ncbi:MAG: serine/threonine protein kinase [Prevotella sp.]|nr:serine/threonine protein kinase [Prevotella sp.]